MPNPYSDDNPGRKKTPVRSRLEQATRMIGPDIQGPREPQQLEVDTAVEGIESPSRRETARFKGYGALSQQAGQDARAQMFRKRFEIADRSRQLDEIMKYGKQRGLTDLQLQKLRTAQMELKALEQSIGAAMEGIE